MPNLNSTLEKLEKSKWEDPKSSSHVISECHRLRKVPLSQFTTEDLRLMIGQGLSLEYLVPLALDKLTDNPFSEGDFYPGDLLKAVLGVKWEFWESNKELFSTLNDIMSSVEGMLETAQNELIPSWQSYFR